MARIPDATGVLLFEHGAFKPSILSLGGGGTGHDISFEKLVVLIALFVGVVVGVSAVICTIAIGDGAA